VEVRTDSAYVVNGVSKNLAAWRRHGFMRRGGPVKNADLWKLLDSLLQSRASDTWKVTKVRGHVTADEVLSGKVAAIDKYGNDQADALAVAGSYSRSADGSGERFRRQVVLAKAAQRMMLDILVGRELRRKHLDTQGGDADAQSTGGESFHSTDRWSEGPCSPCSEQMEVVSESSWSCSLSDKTRGRSSPAAAE